MDNGKCCAGCDHWHTDEGIIGTCHNSKIIPDKERAAMLGMQNLTLDIGAGHAITPREHVCNNFKDDFDWQSLPPLYLKQIGYKD